MSKRNRGFFLKKPRMGIFGPVASVLRWQVLVDINMTGGCSQVTYIFLTFEDCLLHLALPCQIDSSSMSDLCATVPYERIQYSRQSSTIIQQLEYFNTMKENESKKNCRDSRHKRKTTKN